MNSCNNVEKPQPVKESNNTSSTSVTQTLPSVTKTKPSVTKKPVIKEIAGSKTEGKTILNADDSLACSLKSWRLIGTAGQGEMVFKITNRGKKSRRSVLVEVLILDQKGNDIRPINPFRKLQGESLSLEPLLQKNQTREVEFMRKHQINWHKIELKTCRWLEKNKRGEYEDIYPELKNYPMP